MDKQKTLTSDSLKELFGGNPEQRLQPFLPARRHKVDENVISARIRPDVGDGGAEITWINNNLTLTLSQVRAKQQWEDAVQGADYVKINFQLSGSGHYDLGTSRTFSTRKLYAGLLIQPSGLMKKERYAKDEEEFVSAMLQCERQLLTEYLKVSACEMPQQFRDYLEGKPSDFFWAELPMTFEIAQATKALFQHQQKGNMGRVYKEAKSIELICLFMQLLQSHGGNADASSVSRKENAWVHAAKEIIDSSFCAPPTINELARTIGTNQVKLSEIFKRILGVTIFEYADAKRMQHASFLLSETDFSITRIALEVGYDHPGNFTTAFKRRFGVTPREFRNSH